MSYLAKGVTLKDGTYIFKCGKCNGAGKFRGAICDWCYNLDAKALSAAMKESRGERYYGLLKSLLSVIGKSIVDDCNAISEKQDGKFTPVDGAYLSLKYGLNLKATFEWLEETYCIKSGQYDLMKRYKIKVGDLYAKAREKWNLELEEQTNHDA